MRHLLIGLGLILFGYQVWAQKTEGISDINSKGSAFPFGSKIFEGEKICFQAFDRNGNTALYYMGPDGTKTIKSWDNTDHSVFIHAVISFANQVVFSVVNDSANNGIWQWTEKGGAKLIYQNAQLNEQHAYFNDKMYVNAAIPNEKGFVFSIDNSGKWKQESAFNSEVNNVAIERMLVWQNKLLINYKQAIFDFDGSKLHHNHVLGHDHLVSETFIFNDHLYLNGKKPKGNLKFYQVDTKGHAKELGNVCPNEYCLDAFTPLISENAAFFLSNSDKKGEAIYELSKKGEVVKIQNQFYNEKSSRFSSYCVAKDGLFFCSKPDDASEYSVWQYAMDTLIPFRMDNARNPLAITSWGEDLLMIARHENYDFEPIKVEPFKFPSIKFFDYAIMETTPKGRKIGQIEVDKKNSKKLKYDIVGGNAGDAFTIDPYDGSIYIQNTDSLSAKNHPVFDLEIKIITSCFKPVVHVPINLLVAKPLDMNNLQERFLFYPDFDRKGYLLTSVLEDGEHITVYNLDFRMVDELVVANKSIYVSGYKAGIYILNAKNKDRNYFQKIELK
jgi:hypothetical protein